MPYRRLTIQDVARLLGADLRRVGRMAQRAEIPCQKVGGQYRFHRAEITDWLQQQVGVLSSGNLAQIDAGIGAEREAGRSEQIVTPLLHPEAVAIDLHSRTKQSTLRKLVALAQRTHRILDEQELLGAVMHREELGSTALEGGIAIPHSRRPLPFALSAPILAVARTTQGIVFGAPDGKLTNLFFLTASLDDHHHLHLLARLCRMLCDRAFVRDLVEAKTTADIVDGIAAREREILSA